MAKAIENEGKDGMVYVQDRDGRPLMPTERHGKVRRMLDDGRAVVVCRCPFTIRLEYGTSGHVQTVTLGVDAGSKHVGLSATTDRKELYSAQCELRTDIVELLSTRRALRKARRGRTTRYRKPRFANRRKGDGWLVPSVRCKVDEHVRIVDKVCKILPIAKVVVEVALFNIQKIKNPNIKGVGYQEGEQRGFCDLKVKRGEVLWDAVRMNVMMWSVYMALNERHSNVSLMYGHKTRSVRIENGIEKSNTSDAYCVSGNVKANRSEEVFRHRFVRRHNRQIHKMTILKGGVRKANQAARYVNGFQLFDKVRFDGVECYVAGRRTSGKMLLRDFEWNKVRDGVSWKRLTLVSKTRTLLTERRSCDYSQP